MVNAMGGPHQLRGLLRARIKNMPGETPNARAKRLGGNWRKIEKLVRLHGVKNTPHLIHLLNSNDYMVVLEAMKVARTLSRSKKIKTEFRRLCASGAHPDVKRYAAVALKKWT